MPKPSQINDIQDRKEKRKRDSMNMIAAMTELFKNFANPRGNMQGAIQNVAGILIGFLVNMFGGVLAKIFGGSPQQVADLANSAKDAFGRHIEQGNAFEQQRQQQCAQVVPSSSTYTPSFSSSRGSEDSGYRLTDLSNTSGEEILFDSGTPSSLGLRV